MSFFAKAGAEWFRFRGGRLHDDVLFWLAALLLCLLQILLFMRGYRLSADDAGLTQDFTRGYMAIWHAAAGEAHAHGRIGMYLLRPINTLGAYWSGYAPARFAFVSLYFANFLLFSIYTRKLLRVDLTLLLFVILVGLNPLTFEHMPPNAYPLQNSVPIFFILLARILLQPRQGSESASGPMQRLTLYAIFAIAMFMSEYALVFGTSLLIAEYGLYVLERGLGFRPSMKAVNQLLRERRLRIDLTIALAVLAGYTVFRWMNPSQYEGNAPDAIGRVGAVIRTAAGHILSGTMLPRLNGSMGEAPKSVLVIGVLSGLLAFTCLTSAIRRLDAIRQPVLLACGALSLAFYICLPLASTAKQQAWCLSVNNCGFLDSRISYLWFCVFGLCAVAWLWKKLTQRLPVRLVASCFCLMFGLLVSVTYAYNWHQAKQMSSISQAWGKAEAIACYPPAIPTKSEGLDLLIDPHRAVQFHPNVGRDAYWKSYVAWGTKNFKCPQRMSDRKRNYHDMLDESTNAKQMKPGELIRFSDGQGQALLAENWSISESWGTWSTGRHSTLRAIIEPGKDMNLSLKAIRHDPHGASLPVTVRINGQPVANLYLTGKPKTFQIPVPAATIGRARREATTIEFLVPDAVSPQQDGSGSDGRVLGVGLIEIRLDPVS